MTLPEIEAELSNISNEMDNLLGDETIISFPKAYNNQVNRINDLLGKIQDAIEEKEKEEEKGE